MLYDEIGRYQIIIRYMEQYLINNMAAEEVSMVQNEQCTVRAEMNDCLDKFININTGIRCDERSEDVRVWNLNVTC